MYLWMLVSMDKYELPLAVADSASQLARMVGANRNTIFTSIYQARTKGYRSKYVKVEIEEDDLD